MVGSPWCPKSSQESFLIPQFKSIHSLAFFIVQLSHPYMPIGKTIAMTRGTFVGKAMSLLFNKLSRLVGTSLVAQMVKHLPTMWETWVQSLVGKISWKRKWQPTPGFVPGESHTWRCLVGLSPWGHKESDMTERLHFHSLSLSLLS